MVGDVLVHICFICNSIVSREHVGTLWYPGCQGSIAELREISVGLSRAEPEDLVSCFLFYYPYRVGSQPPRPYSNWILNGSFNFFTKNFLNYRLFFFCRRDYKSLGVIFFFPFVELELLMGIIFRRYIKGVFSSYLNVGRISKDQINLLDKPAPGRLKSIGTDVKSQVIGNEVLYLLELKWEVYVWVSHQYTRFSFSVRIAKVDVGP